MEDITDLDKKMNGGVLERKYGGLSAISIFKKEGWELAPSAPPSTPTNTPTKKSQTKTTELVEKWKNKATRKTCSGENDIDNDDSSAVEQQPLDDSQHTTKKARRDDV